MTEKTVTAYSVTIEEVKKQLNIDCDYVDDDGFISTLIEAATDFISGEIAADVEVTLNKLAITQSGTINEAPLISVDKVTIDEVETTDYEVDPKFACFEIDIADDFESGEIEFTTGFETIPPALRQAIIIKAASLYDQERGEVVIGTSISRTDIIQSLIRKYKRKYW